MKNNNIEKELEQVEESLKNYGKFEQAVIEDFNNYKEAIKKAAK